MVDLEAMEMVELDLEAEVVGVLGWAEMGLVEVDSEAEDSEVVDLVVEGLGVVDLVDLAVAGSEVARGLDWVVGADLDLVGVGLGSGVVVVKGLAEVVGLAVAEVDQVGLAVCSPNKAKTKSSKQVVKYWFVFGLCRARRRHDLQHCCLRDKSCQP